VATTTKGAAETAPTGYAAVVHHPIAGRLIAVKTVSEVGDFVGLAALLLLSYKQTGSLLGAAAVYTARSLPAILVATLLGGWLDVPRRRPALVALALAGAGALTIPSALPTAGSAVAAAALLGAIRAAYMAITTAVVAESVERPVQLPFFGLAGTINAVAQVGGIAAGSALTLALGPRTALLLDVASFLIAAVMLGTVPIRGRGEHRDRLPPGAGFVLIWRQPTLRILAILTWATLLCSVLPEVVATNAVTTGWIPAVMAASALGGGLFMGIMGRSHFLERSLRQAQTAVVLGLALLAGAAVLFTGANPVLLILANLAIGAATGWTVGAQATFARLAPAERMGQIEATMIASNLLLEGVGVLVLSAAAVLTRQDGAAYLIGGILVLGAALPGLRPLRLLDAADRPLVAE
jgi:MFS family permease